MVLWVVAGYMCVVPYTMYFRCGGGAERKYINVLGVYVSEFWISTSEWVCDRTAIYGKLVACPRDNKWMAGVKETK